jgi:hypothetical protein
VGSMGFNDLIDYYSDLLDAAFEAVSTEDADLRTNGEAGYQGFLTVGENNTGDGDANPTYVAVGEANATVDFKSGDVSGAANNFYEIGLATLEFDDEDQDLSEIGAPAISRSLEVTLNGTSISGSLMHLDGEEAMYGLAVQDVEYRGNDAEYLVVTSCGTSSAAGRSDIDAYGNFFGVETAASN